MNIRRLQISGRLGLFEPLHCNVAVHRVLHGRGIQGRTSKWSNNRKGMGILVSCRFLFGSSTGKNLEKNENAFIHPISELGDPAVSKKKAFSAHTEEDWRRALRLPKRVVHIVSLAGTRHPEQTAGPTASGVTLTPRRHSVTQSVELLTTDDSSKGLQGQQVLRGKSGAYPRTHKPPFFPCVCVIT